MPNVFREMEEGGFYHIFNRGNHRQSVFLEPFDYQYFLTLIADNAVKYEISILAYCLMRNHYHFEARQLSDNNQSIAKWIGCSTMSYANYFNRKYGQVGSLFQGRFKSKRIKTDEYLYHLSKYIHLNPEDFTDPLNYPWSSIQSYINARAAIADPSYILKYLKGRPYELALSPELAAEKEVGLVRA